MALLNRRDHRRRELITKLEQKFLRPLCKSKTPPILDGADGEEILSLCCETGENLEQLGLINDKRYARHWVELRLKRHPEAFSTMEAGLSRKGVERELIRYTSVEAS